MAIPISLNVETGGNAPHSLFNLLDDSSPYQQRDIHPLHFTSSVPSHLPTSSARTTNPPLSVDAISRQVKDTTVAKTTNAGSSHDTPWVPEKLPTLEEFLNAARSTGTIFDSIDTTSSLEPPPRTILPAFINLRAVERLPYASFEEDGLRKRRRLDISSDHFAGEHVQLPVPQRKHDDQLPRPFGPFAILNGLNEPPPNAALFPPIEPDSVPHILTKPTGVPKANISQANKRQKGKLQDILDLVDTDAGDIKQEYSSSKHAQIEEQGPTSPQSIEAVIGPNTSDRPDQEDDAPMSPKTRGRSRKKLRPWTDQETRDLLKGVVRCGVGNWVGILQQSDLHFNKRSASNLKDRFRFCCPWAYGSTNTADVQNIQSILAEALANTDSNGFTKKEVIVPPSATGKILLPDPRPGKSTAETAAAGLESTYSSNSEIPPQSSEVSTQDKEEHTETKILSSRKGTKEAIQNRKWKALSTLEAMGASAPYFPIKSKRRTRRPFTAAEDEALLKGYAVHGFRWTLIQLDAHLNLSHRKPSDLRDRFRTRFPHAYDEGGSVSARTVNSIQHPVLDMNAGRHPTSAPAPPSSLPLPHVTAQSFAPQGPPGIATTAATATTTASSTVIAPSAAANSSPPQKDLPDSSLELDATENGDTSMTNTIKSLPAVTDRQLKRYKDPPAAISQINTNTKIMSSAPITAQSPSRLRTQAQAQEQTQVKVRNKATSVPPPPVATLSHPSFLDIVAGTRNHSGGPFLFSSNDTDNDHNQDHHGDTDSDDNDNDAHTAGGIDTTDATTWEAIGLNWDDLA